jgi:hypothetical protein
MQMNLILQRAKKSSKPSLGFERVASGACCGRQTIPHLRVLKKQWLRWTRPLHRLRSLMLDTLCLLALGTLQKPSYASSLRVEGLERWRCKQARVSIQ